MPVIWPKIGRYVHPESIQIYLRWKALGIPPYHTGFLEWPEWLVEDLIAIDKTISRVQQVRFNAKLAKLPPPQI